MSKEPENRFTRIARKLIFARISQGLTQDQVAERMGVACDTIHSWETGRRMPTALKLENWAQALGFTLDIIPVASDS